MKKTFNLLSVILLCFILLGCNINNSKKNAEKNTRSLARAARNYYKDELAKGAILDNPLMLQASTLNVDNPPSSGTVTISYLILEDTITVVAKDLVFDKYICQYKNEKATCKEK